MEAKLEAMNQSHDKGKMALDLVEFGDGNIDSYGVQDRVDKILPEGIRPSMLYRDVIKIAWPSFVELTLTQLASMVDLMMVGQLGSWAITSVGLTTQPKFLMMTAFMAMNVGATTLIARYKGAGEPEKANRILRQSMLLTFILSILASALGYLFAEPLVEFMGATDAQTLAGGTVYLKIQMLGMVGLAMTSTVTAALRGIGDSKTAMVYNLIANGVNVVLNYLLIEGNFGFPRMEVAGASLATIIGQWIAFTIAMVVIVRGNEFLRLRIKEGFKPHKESLKSIFNIGLPAMVEQLMMRTGMIIYSITVAGLGSVAYATHQICMNVMAMSFMSGQSFSISATSLVGQSLGKKRPDMAQAYSRSTRHLGMGMSILLALVFFFLGKPIVDLYSNEATVINLGAKILILVAFIQPFQSSQFILAGALRGAGDTRTTAVITFITILIIRPGLALFTINVLHMGLEGPWIAVAVDQLIRSLLVLIRFNSGKWKAIEV